MGRVFFNTRKNVHNVSAAYTALASDSGKVFFINQGAGYAISLPNAADAQEGWNCKFIIGTAAAAAVTIEATDADGDNIIALGLDMEDGAVGNQSTGCDVITFISGAEKGDQVELVTDGTTWYAISVAADKAHITYS